MTHRRCTPLITIVLLWVLAPTADAHAILLSSTPQIGQVFHGPEASIKLRFNLRIDGKRSRLTLITPDGARSVLELGNQPSPDTLISQAKGLRSGSYIIQWQVLANDGHITRGEVPFRVQ